MLTKEQFDTLQRINRDNKGNNKLALPSHIINIIGFYATRGRDEKLLFEQLVPFLTRDDIGFFTTNQDYPFLDAKKTTGIEHFGFILEFAFERLTLTHTNNLWGERLESARVQLNVVLDEIIDASDKSNIPGPTTVSKAYLAFAAMQPNALVLKALLDRMKARMELPATDHFHMTRQDFESIINRRCESAYTPSPLDFAIADGNHEAFRLLLDAGATMDIAMPNHSHYRHPLEIAIRFNRTAIFNDLMRRIQAYPLLLTSRKLTGNMLSNQALKIPIYDWRTWHSNDVLLQAAFENSQYEMMALLIKKGADPVKLCDQMQVTFLDMFIAEGSKACAQAYLEKFAGEQIETLLTTPDQNIVKNIYSLIQLVGGYEEAFTLLHIKEDALKMGRLYALGKASELDSIYKRMTSLNSGSKIVALKALASNPHVNEDQLREAYGTQRGVFFTSRETDTVKNMPSTLQRKLYPQ